jgi:hypothetical protein
MFDAQCFSIRSVNDEWLERLRVIEFSDFLTDGHYSFLTRNFAADNRASRALLPSP